MQTQLADFIRDTRLGQEAEAILRSCVHCGFCTATCPTYQLLGDELDGPRGRIYLIKSVLEGASATEKTMLHLDRCLTCRACESTCPSGVRYGRLVDIGRHVVEQQVRRGPLARWQRIVLRAVLTRRHVFGLAYRMGQMFRFALPAVLRDKILPRTAPGPWPRAPRARRMLMLEGCVQPGMAPNINAATARVLDAVGVQVLCAQKAGCCGAIRQHLNDAQGARQDMRRNIDAWWPYVEEGVDTLLINASGCGAMIKEYGHLLADDPQYAAKAAHIASMARDLAEVVPDFQEELVARMRGGAAPCAPIAWHPPCTLQHAQKIRGRVEALLTALGVQVRLCADSHLCCGSAGTYSVTQPALSQRLRSAKLERLQETGATRVLSANIGCIAHLQSGTDTPVEHWIEWVDRALASQSAS